MFPGYDSYISEAAWFPVVCEIKNDGPTFSGVIEFQPSQFNNGQTRRMAVELPTGTLKRVVLPAFAAGRFQNNWDVRLYDESGRVRAEQTGLQPRRLVPAGGVLLGAMPRTPSGLPVLRQADNVDSEMQPVCARLQTPLFPDNPLVLEGLTALYLNSEKAVDLNIDQVNALLAWLNGGGHLIVAVEQPGDVNSVPWLRKLIPASLTDLQPLAKHAELHGYVRGVLSVPYGTAGAVMPNPAYSTFIDLPEDTTFEQAPMQVVTAQLQNAEVLAQSGSVPLIIRGEVGHGRVTVLLFSPEREPVRSWKNLPSFWARMAEVPPPYYSQKYFGQRNAWSIDGVFGAMIDSRQVRKLPVGWLLLLLVVYLGVIGPFDQYWLKRIRRPMLTWITFPCYVVLFSLLIYFIGYKLRAGQSEWNELHVVDVLLNGESAELRGHTYADVYSPVNAILPVAAQEHYSAFRGVFQGNMIGSPDSEKADIEQAGDNYKALVHVPVWTSQLFESDWWDTAPIPLTLNVTRENGGYAVEVGNRLEQGITNVNIVVEDRLIPLGALAAGQTNTWHVQTQSGVSVNDFVNGKSHPFQQAVMSRRNAFGDTARGQIDDLPQSCMAVSFISLATGGQPGESGFIAPPGMDLAALLGRHQAVLLAWTPDYSPVKPLNQFTARRASKYTLWRLAAPVVGAGPL